MWLVGEASATVDVFTPSGGSGVSLLMERWTFLISGRCGSGSCRSINVINFCNVSNHATARTTSIAFTSSGARRAMIYQVQ